MKSKKKFEYWIPCGFSGDKVNSEVGIENIIIIDGDKWTSRLGPKLVSKNGGCAALTLPVLSTVNKHGKYENNFRHFKDNTDELFDIENRHICVVGGSAGPHDSRTAVFYNTIQCYDRIKSKWFEPFPKLPSGADHLNALIMPRSSCNKNQPARILVMNARTKAYGPSTTDIWALDLEGANARKDWYVIAGNPPPIDDDKDEVIDPNDDVRQNRDAAGVNLVDNGRILLNFGGVSYFNWKTGKKIKPMITHDTVRGLDLCKAERNDRVWQKVGKMDLTRFAIQSCMEKDDFIHVCGGDPTTFVPEKKLKAKTRYDKKTVNIRDCEIFSVSGLVAAMK